MSLELAREIWDELKQYLTSTDQSEAADAVVNLLIDNDYNLSDISSAFKGYPEIKQSLSVYADDLVDEDDEEDDDDYYDYDDSHEDDEH